MPDDEHRAEVEAWAHKMRVRPKVVHVRPMKRKWGSCSTTGRVTFDADLLRQHVDFRKRVIVEELLHLRFPNHGKVFRALLRAHLGQGLRSEGAALEDDFRTHGRESDRGGQQDPMKNEKTEP